MSSRFTARQLAVVLALLEIFRGSFVTASEPQDELKAAIVLSFLRYSEWPAGHPGDSPIIVGVLGRPSFFQVLRGALDGKTVNNHPIRTIELTAVTDPRCCQVIYFATEKGPEIKAVLLNAPTAHALTIGEADKFLEAGGAVRLTMLDGHMSFEVNLEMVDRSAVVISSKLLRYGEIRGRPRP